MDAGAKVNRAPGYLLYLKQTFYEVVLRERVCEKGIAPLPGDENGSRIQGSKLGQFSVADAEIKFRPWRFFL